MLKSPPMHPDRPNSGDNHPPQPKRKRRSIRIAVWIVLGVVAVALVYAVGMSLYAIGTLSRHPGFSAIGTADTTPIPVKIGGRHYRIPANYFRGPITKDDEQKALLLLALWPGLEGRTEENWADFSGGDWGRKVLMLFEANTPKITALERVQLSVELDKNNSAPLSLPRNIDGLEYFEPIGTGKQLTRHEFFIKKIDEKIVHYITCSPDKSAPFPGCTLWFALGEKTRAKVSFAKPLFSQWPEIQAAVIALMQRFETAAHLPSPPTDR